MTGYEQSVIQRYVPPVPADDPDYVWLGDLSGFEVETDDSDFVFLTHRCGWSEVIDDSERYLANIVTRVVQVRKRHRCDWPNQVIPR